MRSQRYTVIRLAARTAEIRSARFDGAEHLVIPCVCMVGDAVVRPMHSEGPEFVPAEELAVAPSAWDGRPVLGDHPEGGTGSANNPRTLEAARYGSMFNTRYEDGALRTEAWIDLARAERIGGEALRVARAAERAMAGEQVDPIECSVGAWVSLRREDGVSPSGKRYEYRWAALIPDHLAVGLNGSPGACSVEGGCGALRSNSEGSAPRDDPAGPVMRVAARSQARRPTFSGTETSSWSSPSWASYIRYLFEGQDGPASVAAASSALKRRVAAHSLLGDPEATTLRELTMFPVVNPANGNLNENALRAVLGGRGAQANISEGARTSAQDMARRLLNSEFGAELEAAKMDDKQDVTPRDAAESENLNQWLRDALEDAERGYDYIWVESFDAAAGTVVYCVRYQDGPSETYRRTFEIDEASETIALGAERTAVRRKITYEDAPEVTAASRMARTLAALPAPLVKALEACGIRAAADDTSDVALRESMWSALRSNVPAFVDIAEIYPSTSTVIYSTRPEDHLHWWRRTYEMNDRGAVALNDDAEEVVVEQSWRPVAAVGEQATLFEEEEEQDQEGESKVSAASGGPDPKEPGEGHTAQIPDDTEGGKMATNAKQEIVGRLIKCGRCPFDDTEEDRKVLDSMSEAKLKALEESYAEKEEPAEPEKPAPAAPEKKTAAAAEPEGEKAPAAPAGPVEDIVQLKREEYEDILAAARAHKAEQARQHSALVAQLKEKAKDAYTEDELNAMPLEQLRKTAKLLKVDAPKPVLEGQVDYSLRAQAADPSAGRKVSLPDPFGLGSSYYDNVTAAPEKPAAN